MTHDPFLDGPRDRRGCAPRTLAILAVEAACGLVVAAGALWGVGDAVAVVALLAVVYVLVKVALEQLADLHAQGDESAAMRAFETARRELAKSAPPACRIVMSKATLDELGPAAPGAPSPTLGFPVVVSEFVPPGEILVVNLDELGYPRDGWWHP